MRSPATASRCVIGSCGSINIPPVVISPSPPARTSIVVRSPATTPPHTRPRVSLQPADVGGSSRPYLFIPLRTADRPSSPCIHSSDSQPERLISQEVRTISSDSDCFHFIQILMFFPLPAPYKVRSLCQRLVTFPAGSQRVSISVFRHTILYTSPSLSSPHVQVGSRTVVCVIIPIDPLNPPLQAQHH